MKISWFLLLAGCGIVASQSSKCTKRDGIESFDSQRFSGAWYVVGLSQPYGRLPLTCFKINYTAVDQGNVTRIDMSVHIKTSWDQEEMVLVVRGQTFQPGIRSVSQAVNKPKNGNWNGDVAEHVILGTDYDQFAIFYSCLEKYEPEEDKFLRHHSYQIWSRNQTLDDVVFSTLKTMVGGLEHEIALHMEDIKNTEC